MTRRNKIVVAIMFLFGLLVIGLSLRDVNFKTLMHDLVNISPYWMFVALICICLYIGIEGYIVKVFMDDRLEGFTFKDALRIPMIEQLFNGITPFSSGGQPAQLFAMLQTGVDGGRASSVLLMKFVLFQGLIVINFLISLIIGFHYLASKLSYLSLFVILGFLIHLAVIIGLLLIMYWPSFTKRLVRILLVPVKWFSKDDKYQEQQKKFDSKIDTFYLESVRIAHRWPLLLKVIGLTFLQLFFYYLIPYFIMLALGYSQVNILMVTSLHVLIVMVISLFPIPGGAGGAEFSFEALFASFIPSHSKLVLAMILWRLLTYYFGMISGLVAMWIKPNKVQENNSGK